MRLTAQVIESFEDATLNFEQIQSILSNPQAEPLAYLQLVSAQKLQIDSGSVVNGIVWPGASAFSNALVINHGLGRTPKTIDLTPARSAGGAWWFPVATARSATSITVVGCDPFGSPAAGDTATIDWTAFG